MTQQLDSTGHSDQIKIKSSYNWNSLKQNVITYLVTTTIHGCRYLYDGQSRTEKLAWLVIICSCFAGAVVTITNSLDEAAREPILTTLYTTKIENVPFPAVTIGGDANVNPWGFAEKALNFLAFYGPKVNF